MSELLGYVVKSPARGGWNKRHIWAAWADDNGATLLPLCNKGRRSSPQHDRVNLSYAESMVRLSRIKPENTAIPMQGFDHSCDKCQRVWFGLRNVAGHVVD